ncbi:MAG: uracil-DNA glycosylase [Ottowia sp.]|nr:uracil-DNA glycosylase [Burkholderiaceae bacterium]
MTLDLDMRQRAMLAEMGVRLWAPQPKAPAAVSEEAPSDQAVAPTPSAAPAPPARARIAPPAGDLAPSSRPAGVEAMDWDALQAAVAGCRACGLCAGRTQAVFGVGSRTAGWMVVGEAPGETEDRLGEPFVGAAGKLLDNMLAAIGLSRQAGDTIESIADGADSTGASGPNGLKRGVYIANVIKCRPPGNRNPLPEEVAQCEPYLRRQVALVRPRIILALGRFAVQSLLNTTEPIGRLRGRVHQYQGVPVIVSYHPAYLLRALPEKAKAWQDLCLALATAQQGADAAAAP